jgi:signal transduction histidine kinase
LQGVSFFLKLSGAEAENAEVRERGVWQDFMKVCLVGGGSQFHEDCRTLLQELVPGECELITSISQPKSPEADIYIWDFSLEMFSPRLTPEIVRRSLFAVEPKLLERFRERLRTMQASILLKPVRPAALRPFLEHAVRQYVPAATAPSPNTADRGAMDDLLDCLLHANLKLQEYDHFRTNFLARAVHDFRAPLTALGGYCGLLVDQRLGPLNASQTDLLLRMQHSVMRLSGLVDAMLDLSAARNAKREPDLQTGDIQGTISQSIHEVTPHADEKQIRITVRADAPHQPLRFDSAKIEQVLISLLENGCKFTSKKGAIHVAGYPVSWNRRSARPSRSLASNGNGTQRAHIPNAYRIDVRDSGSGIPSEHVRSIFEEYTSYSGGIDRSGGGLGLAICRMIVEAHRGTIWAESGPDGTQFSIVLPQAEAKDSRLGVEKAAAVMTEKASSA